MSTSAVLTILSLFSAHVLAQVYSPDCTVSSWGWTFNSIDQNSCTVAAYLQATCNGGTYNIPALPQGSSYAGPAAGTSNACKCSSVVYSLLSACDACQGEPWLTWYAYSINCTKEYPALYFPNPVPAQTRVPQWALIDVTVEGNWNSSKSLTVGDLPEVLPGEMISDWTNVSTFSVGPSSTATASSSSSISSSQQTVTSTSPSSSTGSSGGSSSNIGAIAGGAAGGVVAVSTAAFIVFFFLRRRRAQQPPPGATVYDGTPQPLMGQVQLPQPDERAFIPPSLPTIPTTPMRLYDPNDPTTFPGYQGTVPNMYSGSTVASMQPSRRLGYQGLPTV
ncbi:hypothetical protein BGW80DRAFT_286726 [Lactifluus volemus]|nr:hypothetical protein BGW80DRAFT_286726 [Lactifluus volemus]